MLLFIMYSIVFIMRAPYTKQWIEKRKMLKSA